ncbi:MAG: 3-dehydroquinate synthase, partial [Clostridiales bacterium]|nr:3-dehydroquinate synthase [Clostridiales bacterium]
MKELRVNIPGKEYSIFIGGGILKETGAMLRRVHGGRKAAVVTDENVRPLYGGAVENSLGESGFESTVIAVPAG